MLHLKHRGKTYDFSKDCGGWQYVSSADILRQLAAAQFLCVSHTVQVSKRAISSTGPTPHHGGISVQKPLQ